MDLGSPVGRRCESSEGFGEIERFRKKHLRTRCGGMDWNWMMMRTLPR